MVYTTNFNEIASIIIMVILYTLVYLYISTQIKCNKRIHVFILGAIILRIVLTLIDTYFLYLPNSGSDSVAFESHAYQLLQGTLTLKAYNFDNYPKLIYFVYLIIGRKPIVIRVINGVLSMLTGLLIYKSLILTTQNTKKALMGMLIYLFFPQSIIFSSIILRENFIVYFATLSIYYFIKYDKDNKISNIIKSYISIIFASIFHSGIIFISIPYIYYIIKDKSKGMAKKTKKNIVYLILGIIVVVIMSFPSMFLRKLSFLQSSEALFNKLNSSNEYAISKNVGSAYLSYFRINSFKELILYLPLKILYFLFSPMLWDIRGLIDIITITLDSIFYIIFTPKILLSLKVLKLNTKKNRLIKILIISFILIVTVYAMGTTSTGTAIRHRYKTLSLIIIILMSLEPKNRKIRDKMEGNHENTTSY